VNTHGNDVMKCQACRREQTRGNLEKRTGRIPCCAYCGDTRVKLLRAHQPDPGLSTAPDYGLSLIEIVDTAIDIGFAADNSTSSTPDFDPGGGEFGGGGASGEW
jgi:uncharacterized membrane protein YgcG